MSDVLINEEAAAIRPDCVLYRALDDGRELVVYPLIMGQHRMAIGAQDVEVYDDAFCYHSFFDVLGPVAEWEGDGDPPGRWFRHIGSGRRRKYDAAGNVIAEKVMR